MERENDPITRALRVSLRNAGCPPALREQVLAQYRQGRLDECVRLLTVHRCALLDTLRTFERRLDCLDYLIFRLSQAKKNSQEAAV